jgi:hypothetical protein
MLGLIDSRTWMWVLLAVPALYQSVVSSRRHSSSRRLAVKQFAEEHGLRFGDQMQIAGAALSFTTLEPLIVQSWGLENAVTGEWQGTRIVAGDLWSSDVVPGGDGSGTRTYRSMVMVPGAGHLPYVHVRQVGRFQQALDAATGVRVRFDSDDFNRRFEVDAESTEIAFRVVDQRMMAWLLDSAFPFAFETGAGGVLVTSDSVPPEQLVSLLDAAVGFAQRVPNVARQDAGATDTSAAAVLPGVPAGATVMTTTTQVPLGEMFRSPNRIIVQSNLFGFHSSGSVSGSELRNAFRNGTWGRDPHLRRFVFRQGFGLLLPFLIYGVFVVASNGWIGLVPVLSVVVVAGFMLLPIFHRGSRR